MDKVQALHQFWSSFGIKAYDESSVPSDAQLPYITYDVAIDSFGSDVAMSASLWYYGTSWADITRKSFEIAEVLNNGGKTISYDGGLLWIKKASPFMQRIGDTNDMIRRVLINISAEYID